jgi:hypothetical protein
MTDILGDVLGAAHTNPTAEHLYVDVNEVGVESWRRWQSVLVGEQCDVTSLQTSSHRASQAAKASTLDQLINPSTISHVDI